MAFLTNEATADPMEQAVLAQLLFFIFTNLSDLMAKLVTSYSMLGTSLYDQDEPVLFQCK